MFILCFWPFLRFWAQNAPNPTRFCTFAPFSGLERWHRAENSPFSTQKEKYISKLDLNIFCLFSPPSEPAAPSRIRPLPWAVQQSFVLGCAYFLIQTACIQNATRRTTLRKSRSCSNSRICCSYRETSIACNSVLSAAKNLAEFFWRPQVIGNTLFWW